MDRIPVDMSRLTPIAVGTAEPVMDFATKQAKKTPEGVALYTVPVLLMQPGEPGQVVKVKVAGDPGVGQGEKVRLADLVAMPWSVQDRATGAVKTGVAFRASSITSAIPAGAGKANP
jgi:hypothetical protein